MNPPGGAASGMSSYLKYSGPLTAFDLDQRHDGDYSFRHGIKRFVCTQSTLTYLGARLPQSPFLKH